MSSSDDARQKLEESTPTFPTEVVAEILSWLPLKPLLRAQLVCKDWRTAMLEHHFIHKHKVRSHYAFLFYNTVDPPSTTPSQGLETERAEPYERFESHHGCDGLMLMRSHVSGKYVIWNPALRLLLPLPDPHHGSYAFAFSYIRATQSYRVVSIYKEKESNFHGWEVLTPGHSMAWRRATIPDIIVNANQPQEKLKVVSAGGAVHCIQVSEVGKKIVTLDMETECFTVNHMLSSEMKSEWELDWDGKLALADIVGQNLELMELEDHKKRRWCRNKKIIPLPYYKGCDVVPLIMKEGEIWFSLNNIVVSSYQIETRRICGVYTCKKLSANCKLYRYRPSLVSFEGMQPDTMINPSLINTSKFH